MRNIVDYINETLCNCLIETLIIDIDSDDLETINESNRMIYKTKQSADKYPVMIEIGNHATERQDRHVKDKNGVRIETKWIIDAVRGAMSDIDKLFKNNKIKVDEPRDIKYYNKETGKTEIRKTRPSHVIIDARKNRQRPLNVAFYIDKYHENAHRYDIVVKTVYLGTGFKINREQQKIYLW